MREKSSHNYKGGSMSGEHTGGIPEERERKERAEAVEEKKRETSKVIDAVHTLVKSIAPSVIDFSEKIKSKDK